VVGLAEPHPHADDVHVRATWRAPTADELIHTWSARAEPGKYERSRLLADDIGARDARRKAKRR
jgi:hypothetical protein